MTGKPGKWESSACGACRGRLVELAEKNQFLREKAVDVAENVKISAAFDPHQKFLKRDYA